MITSSPPATGQPVSWRLTSAGRALGIRGPADLGAWWPELSIRLPGTDPHELQRVDEGRRRRGEVAVPAEVDQGDCRRWLGAHLHCLHLRNAALAVHAVAMVRCGRAVLLLGGHGAGKSLVGLGLVEQGWRVAAGDTALVTVTGDGPVLIGGSRAYVVRRAVTARSFPRFPLSGYGDAVDVAGELEPVAPGERGWPIVSAAVVATSSSASRRARVDCTSLDEHSAVSVWYRASGHLLDRVLAGSDRALRSVESPEGTALRIELARRLASRGLARVSGVPTGIAAVIDRRVRGA